MYERANRRPIQTQRVLDHLAAHGSITQYEAMIDLGIMRLASRISELKKDGYPIAGKMIPVKNRFGETCRIKRYSLLQDGGEKDEQKII